MCSFLKSICGMFTSANSTKRETCPDYFHAMYVNHNLRLNVAEGLTVAVNTDVSRVFGVRPTTTFMTNTLTLDLFHPPGLQFGMSYANNKHQAGISADREATVQTTADMDLNGNVSGQVRCRVTDRVTFDVYGGQDGGEPDKSRNMNVAANWSGDRFNAIAVLSDKTAAAASAAAKDDVPRTAFAVECVRQLGDRWTIGGDVVVDTGNDRRQSAAVRYSGGLRYDSERETFVAAADRATNVSLRYRRRVDDELTVGTEVTANVRKETAKVTWMHRARFGDGIEIKGQIDTNRLIVGHMHKAFLQDKFSMGVSASFNHKTALTALGVELTVG